MMKKVIILIALAVLCIGCDKEDPCECYYSNELNQYVPSEKWEQVLIEHPTTGERMQALHNECKAKGCM